MCANYIIPEPMTWEAFFNSYAPTFDYNHEAWPMSMAPMLVQSEERQALEPRRAMFGLVPHWAKDTTFARKTYNARTETVATLASYRTPWKKRQFCLVPTGGFYEPNYESGKAERWFIKRQDDEPFELAGIWESRRHESGVLTSFSMLTINADDHPIMKRMHAPEDEKRSVVVIEPANYMHWLQAEDEDEARSYFKLFEADQFVALPAPRLSTKKSRQ